MTSNIKRPLSTMNSNEIMKQALGYKLRDPVQGEFGYENLIGSLFYMQSVAVEKPLSWFFGNKEHSKHVAWKGFTSQDKTLLDSIRSVEKVIVDGKFEIDDLEMDLQSASSTYTDSGNTFISTDDQEYILITSKISKENFIKEVTEYCRIQTYSDFNKFLVFITEQRNEGHAFKHEKELVCEIYEKVFSRTPKIRSISSMEDVKSEIWGDFMNAGIAIKISEVIELEPTEIYNYFKTIANLNTLIDARSLIYSCTEHDTKKVFKTNETVYLGVLKDRHTSQYSYSDTSKINYKVVFNPDYTRFTVSLIQLKSVPNPNRSRYSTSANANSDLVDIKEINSAIKGLETVFDGAASEQFGTYTNIPISYLRKLEGIRSSLSFDSYQKDRFEENWLPKAKSTMKFSSDKKSQVFNFYPSMVQVPSLSVNDLQDLRTCLMDFYQDHYKDKKSYQIPSGSKEEIIGKVADQFAKVYKEIKPAVLAAVKVSLGCSHSIPRPYIVENIDNSRVLTEGVKIKYSTLSKVATSEIVIKPNLLASTIELMEATKDEDLVLTLSKKFYQKEVKTDKFSMLDSTVKTKKQSTLTQVYDQVAKLKNPGSNAMLQRFNYSALEKNNLICGIFIAICMFEIVENRTFVHFGQNPKSIMVKPKDIVRELLDEGSFAVYTLKESLYINGKARKEAAVNS